MTGERPISSVRFDLLYAALSFWFISGSYLDGWAHNHGRVDNTFLTPWHAVLYSGFAAVAALTVITLVRGRMQGYAWTHALPVGYQPALLGVILFAFGGGFDFLWHNLFGFEANLEALYSPAHLLLATGSFLYLTAPLRAAWQRRDTPTWPNLFPAILALTWTLGLTTFFMQYSHWAGNPDEFINTWGTPQYLQSSYLLYMLVIPSALLVGIVMIALRRWKLPPGTVTFIVTINTIMMVAMRWGGVSDFLPVFIAPILGGILADVLITRFNASPRNPTALRWLAFSVPFVISLTYMLIMSFITQQQGGLVWRIHMSLGALFIAGIIGLFLSFIAAPAAVPEA
jgi:hypothetical protein